MLEMRYLFCSLFLTWVLLACSAPTQTTPTGSTGPSGLEWSSYTVTDIPGSDTKLVVLRDPSSGLIREQGQMRSGLPVGAWEYFSGTEERLPDKLITFADGKYNGPYLEFDDQGNMTLSAHYRNNQLHGSWGVYRYGRPEKIATYVDGQLDGLYQEFNTRTGNPLKEASYRNGKEDGIFRFYNEDGEIMVEYEYRNGEKISGGIVE